MRPDDTKPDDVATLRRQAEEALRAQPARSNGSLSHDEALALVHELQVHQIELELQNEELVRTRREAEALRDRYADLYDFAPVGYFTLDEAGAVREANLAGAVQLGVDRESLVGAGFATSLDPDSRPGFAAFCARILAGGTTGTCDVSFAARAGRGAWYAQLRGRADAAGAAVFLRLVATDITERRRAEEALRESEAKYRSLVDDDITGVFISAFDGQLLDCNPAFARMFGFPSVDEARSSGITGTYDIPAERTALLDRLRRERRIEKDERFRRRRDGTVIHVVENIVGEFDGADNLARIKGYVVDDTQRYRAEEELRRSNEELQRFAYVASHDLQEPLRTIVSFSQLLERRCRGQLGPEADEYVAFIVAGGIRMQALIRDLLRLSRIETEAQPPVAISAGAVVADAVSTLGAPIGETGATVSVGPMPTVMADPGQIEQVFVNLIGNAIKYRSPERPPEIGISAEREGRFWRFAVADNGIGIGAEYFDRIFVIFQRLHTRDEYEGTGIGLAVARKIVERHGGRIWVESTPGEGTTFLVTLPAA
jgi:PAS domain S-box-containing protein